MKMNVLVVIALIAVIVLVIVFLPKQKMTVPPNARAGDLTLESCEYKTKTRTYRAECGTLIVPENRLNPTSRLLALPVKRIHAASDSPREPIVYLGGGPGLSNMRFDPPDEFLDEHPTINFKTSIIRKNNSFSTFAESSHAHRHPGTDRTPPRARPRRDSQDRQQRRSSRFQSL